MDKVQVTTSLLTGVVAVTSFLMSSSAWASCTDKPVISSVAIGVRHEIPVIQYSYSAGQIADLASRAGYKGPHAPLGFYFGQLKYKVDIQALPPSDSACLPSYAIRLDLHLGNRIIEIGTGGPCKRDAMVAHYLSHASQDDRLLREYADLARERLGKLVGSHAIPTEQSSDPNDGMKALAGRIIEDLLRTYDSDRQSALASADTSEELKRLTSACPDNSL